MKMLRRTLLTSGVTAGLASPFLGGSASAKSRINFKIGNSFAAVHPLNIRLNEAAVEIRKATDGELNVQIFPNSELGSDTDLMTQTKSGIIDSVCTSLLFVAALEPSANLAGLGYGYKNYDQVWGVWDGAPGNYVRSKLAPLGLHALDKIFDNGFRQITNDVHPINTPADLAGMKIRVPSTHIQVSLFQHLGAAPTSIAPKDVYSALKTNIVVAEENALPQISAWKFYEVQKYISMTNHMWDGLSVICNQRRLDAVPDAHRKILESTLNKYALLQRGDMVKLNQSLRTSLVSQNHMVLNETDPAPFHQKLIESGYYAEWHKVIGDQAWSLYQSVVGAS